MIRLVELKDKESWYSLDKHLPEAVFDEKVACKQGYVYVEDEKVIGVLRYNLFWDNTPFCTMLFIDSTYRSKGYGKQMIEYWEQDMKSHGYGMIMTSTQSTIHPLFLNCSATYMLFLPIPHPKSSTRM